MKFSVRSVTKEELERIYRDFKNIEVEYGVPDAKEERCNITVEDEETIIAMASGLINHKWFNLTDLWVDEKYRGQGLGTKVLESLEEQIKLKGIEHIYTWTTGYNKNEIFYKKQGYKEFAILENFFEIENGNHIGLRKDLL
jgi:N-acetylglutamate synthase-like GNAT family acetyltransferase